jgi:hypothetical protein
LLIHDRMRLALAAVLVSSNALADDLPPATSDHDPAPPVAAPAIDPADGVVEQAGVGGDTAYGRAGVLELGGNAGLMMSPNFRVMNFSPLLGWFVSDSLELSAIAGVTHIKAGDSSSTVWETLVEPSYHVPFNRTTFGFIGMGVGAAYVSQLGAGLAVSPRIGLNVLVGRSGVLTPSLSYEYTTHNVQMLDSEQAKNITLVAVSTALRLNIGYTAMW